VDVEFDAASDSSACSNHAMQDRTPARRVVEGRRNRRPTSDSAP
jgi:hypothetical protein